MVRHTDVHNPRSIIYGRLPRFRLSERGKAEAQKLADFLTDHEIHAIYASPQLRARLTAGYVAARHGLRVRTLSGLAEVNTGWEGSPNKLFAQKDFSFYEPELKRPGDDTIAMVFQRMERTVRLLRRRHEGQTVLCVSHADPIMILKIGLWKRELTQKSIKEPDYPGKGSITTIEFAGPDAEPVITYFDPVQSPVEKPEGAAEATVEPPAGETPNGAQPDVAATAIAPAAPTVEAGP